MALVTTPVAGVLLGTLSTALVIGSVNTAIAITATTHAANAGDILQIGVGPGAQQVVVTTTAAGGGTSISVNDGKGTSFISVLGWAVGTPVVLIASSTTT